jgi:hypothetical protein
MGNDALLTEIEEELLNVQVEKESLQTKLRTAEERETRLASLAHNLREFLAEREAKTPPARSSGFHANGQAERTRRLAAVARGESDQENLGTIEYAEKILRQRAPLSGLATTQLIEQMQQLGFTSDSKSVYTTVFGILNRAAKRPDGPIVKVDRRWALREWYPDGVPVQQDNEEEEEQPNADH